MITDAILAISLPIFNTILSILPTTLPTIVETFNSSIVYLFSYVNYFDFILPVSDLFTIIVFIIEFEVIMFGLRLTIWLLNLVPFISVSRVDNGVYEGGGYSLSNSRGRFSSSRFHRKK
jgi:hypothetical protein